MRTEDQKQKIREYLKKYYLKNKEGIIERSKKWALENRDKRREISKKWSLNNPGGKKEISKIYKLKNPERNKRYYKNNKERIKKKVKEYYKNNKERIKNAKRTYFQKNKKIIYNKLRKKLQEDKLFYLRDKIRKRLKRVLNLYSKNGKTQSTNEYGINFNLIIERLKPFPEDINNYHVDHIIPLSLFDFDNSEHIKIAFAPENHQWLTIEENLRKGNRLIMPH